MVIRPCSKCRELIAIYPCRYCGFDPKAGDAKPVSPLPERSTSRRNWIIIIGIGIIAMSLTGAFRGACGKDIEEAHRPPAAVEKDPIQRDPDDTPDIDVVPTSEVDVRADVEELWSDYAVNAHVADEKYKGKTLATMGRVTYISNEGRLTIGLTMVEASNSHEVRATIREQDTQKFQTNVAEGDVVILVCMPLGIVDGTVALNDCTYVR